MILYIVRHGDPDYEHNTITPYGHQEAQALADWFDHVKLDRIYTSPLGRAKDTAFYTAQKQAVEPVVLPWTEESMDYMRPFAYGDRCTYRFSAEEGVTDFCDFYGEDRSAVLNGLSKQCDAWLSELGYIRDGAHYRIEHANDERVALFCHGGFGSAMTAHLLGMPPAMGFLSMFMTTSSVNSFTFVNHESGYTRPRMLRFGEITHLLTTDLADERV